MPTELKFKNGSVWVKTVQVHTTDLNSRRKWLLYFSFIPPEKDFSGETIKDQDSRPMTWDSEDEAMKYANIFFEYILG